MTAEDADPGPGPVTVLRVHRAGWPPQRAAYYLCPAPLAARLAADAAAGSADVVTDIGAAFALCQPAARHEAGFHLEGMTLMVLVGVTDDGHTWARWDPPSPVEPVPGSPGAAAQAN
jgi:hypothetical protein